jgi:hypothetical protein
LSSSQNNIPPLSPRLQAAGVELAGARSYRDEIDAIGEESVVMTALDAVLRDNMAGHVILGLEGRAARARDPSERSDSRQLRCCSRNSRKDRGPMTRSEHSSGIDPPSRQARRQHLAPPRPTGSAPREAAANPKTGQTQPGDEHPTGCILNRGKGVRIQPAV